MSRRFPCARAACCARGYSEEVDRLRNIRDNGAQMVQELETRERQRTGAKS